MEKTSGEDFLDEYVQKSRGQYEISAALRKEYGMIMKQLDDLYYGGRLEYEQWQEKKKKLKDKYDKMVKTAPRPEHIKQIQQPQQTEKQTLHTNDIMEFFDRKFGTEEESIESKKENSKEDIEDAWIKKLEEKYGFDDFDLGGILRQQEIAENIESSDQSGRRMM